MRRSIFETVLVFYARCFPIRRGKMRVIESLWQVASGANGTQRMANLRHDGFKMSCDISQMLQRQYYYFGTYFVEDHIIRCWEHAAKDAQTIFDVGANAGIYSLAALAIQQDASVFAFEPTPETAAWLRQTAKLNGLDQLHVCELAVSQHNGEAVLRHCRGDYGTNEGMNYIVSDLQEPSDVYVKKTSLDRFCEANSINQIDLMKLDIQGHEHLALLGARELIKSGRIGRIFIELNWTKGPVCPATESIRLLQQAGYQFSAPEKHLRWRDPGDWLQNLNDVVAGQPHLESGTLAP